MKAMYLTAFYAFLRIGEITHASTPVNNIQWQSVQFLLNDNQIPYAFELNMERFKHNAGKTCHKLRVQHNCQKPEFCPVQALWHYCKLRGNFAGPLFCFINGTPVSRSFFSQS